MSKSSSAPNEGSGLLFALCLGALAVFAIAALRDSDDEEADALEPELTPYRRALRVNEFGELV